MKYKVYDTIIDSEIELLNLPEYTGNDANEASIILSSEASSYIPNRFYGTYYSPELIALGTAHGTIEVSKGSEIKIHLYPEADEKDIAPFIIGWAFAFLFTERNCTIFHCSALNINNHGVILSGVSGAGKSTTALSLIESGAKYLADDLAVISSKDVTSIIPSYPVQKVCRDVSNSLDENKLVHINEGRDKFAYYNLDDYCDTPVKATHIILLNVNDGDEVIVTEHSRINKWMKTLECMYLSELYVTFGTPEKDKFNCLKLSEKVKVFEISRPRGKDTLKEITDIINEIVNR